MEIKFCVICNEVRDHIFNGCIVCEKKRIKAAKFFNEFDFNKCDRTTLKAIKHVIQTGGLSFDSA